MDAFVQLFGEFKHFSRKDEEFIRTESGDFEFSLLDVDDDTSLARPPKGARTPQEKYDSHFQNLADHFGLHIAVYVKAFAAFYRGEGDGSDDSKYRLRMYSPSAPSPTQEVFVFTHDITLEVLQTERPAQINLQNSLRGPFLWCGGGSLVSSGGGSGGSGGGGSGGVPGIVRCGGRINRKPTPVVDASRSDQPSRDFYALNPSLHFRYVQPTQPFFQLVGAAEEERRQQGQTDFGDFRKWGTTPKPNAASERAAATHSHSSCFQRITRSLSAAAVAASQVQTQTHHTHTHTQTPIVAARRNQLSRKQIRNMARNLLRHAP